MVEAVVAIGLLTCGSVAFAYAAWLGVRLAAEAKYRTISTIVASQKLEQLRAAQSVEEIDNATEYLDADGTLVCLGGVPCGDEVYVRRWSVSAIPLYPRSVMVVVSSRHAHRQTGEVVLRTMRGRDAQ